MPDCQRCNQPEQYGCGCTTQEMNVWRADEITRLRARLTTERIAGYRIAQAEAARLGAHIVAPEYCDALAALDNPTSVGGSYGIPH